MTLNTFHLADADLGDWEQLLSECDRQRMNDLRQDGATFSWRHRELIGDDGWTIVHYVAVVQMVGRKQLLGQARPMDPRFHHLE